VATRLRDECILGRLTIDELDERLEDVYRAVTRGDLAEITSDLPTPSTELARRRASGGRFFWPGVSPFYEQRHLREPCPRTFATALRVIVPRMGMHGFHLVDEIRPRRMAFRSDSGLILTVMFHPASDGGTDVSAFGHAPRAIRKAFATLTD
jgi:hypothetical protein